jgi:hypothetical protein
LPLHRIFYVALLLPAALAMTCAPFKDDPLPDIRLGPDSSTMSRSDAAPLEAGGDVETTTPPDDSAADSADATVDAAEAATEAAGEAEGAPVQPPGDDGQGATDAPGDVPGDTAADSPGDAPLDAGFEEEGGPVVVWPDGGPVVVWLDASIAQPSSGLVPAVAVGSSDSGSWVIQVDEALPTSADANANVLQYQAGPTIGSLGPSYELTPAFSQAGAAALTATGAVLTVYNCGVDVTVCWFAGQLSTTVPTTVSWPEELSYDPGYRPRVAALLRDGGGQVVVAVHMAGASAGELFFRVGIALSNATGVSGPNWTGEQTAYDYGPSQNPAVAISPVGSLGTATVLEVHQDAAHGLLYREGTLVPGGPTLAWQSAVPYPGSEQGANPAVAIYGQDVLEVHESVAGALLYKVGVLQSTGVLWGPSQQYEAQGANPAIAIDPATGNGVEVHASRTSYGQLFGRAFSLRP